MDELKAKKGKKRKRVKKELKNKRVDERRGEIF